MKRHRFFTLFVTFAALLTAKLSATVTINLSGAALSDASGTALPNNGLVLLVASTTNGTFTAPTSTSPTTLGAFLADDDVIVGSTVISSTVAGINGGFSVALPISLTGNLNAGDPIQLYWFPTLTSASTTAGTGVAYGSYRTDTIMAGSEIAWIMPSDGSTSNLQMLTAVAGGLVLDTAGRATSMTDGSALPPPTISTHPVGQTVNAGDSVNFTVAATGTGLSYQWKKDGANVGGNNASYSIPSATTGDSGSYTVVVSNSGGNITSNAATLTVNTVVVPVAISTHPVGQTVNAGSSVSFTVAATGTDLTYQWKKNGNDVTNGSGGNTATYTLSNPTSTDAGSYTVTVTNSANSVTSSAAVLVVTTSPVITSHPAALTVAVGGSAVFNVTATGTGLSYQWQKNGANVPAGNGSTTATFTIPAASAGDAGNYAVVVTNSAGSTTSNSAALSVTTAPVITAHPAVSQTAVAGTSVSFTVTATGAGLSYQWRKAGNNISGATSATYTINSTAAGDAGSYSVVVTNVAGNVTSNSAVLVMIPAFTAPAPTGYAATATGGATGSNVLVTTASEFRTQVESTSAAIITVSGTITLGTKVSVKSNKTIQGLDANSTIIGNLELASGVSNVIIRGLNITNPGVSGGDGITLLGATNVFITHVTFFDCADTLLRIAAGADNVTVTWNEFYFTTGQTAHRYAALLGAATGETKALRVTLAYNWFSTRVDQQMPDSTYGQVHAFNNYFNTGATVSTQGSIARANAQFLSERNQYTSIVSPLSKTGGGLIRANGNLYTTTTGTAADAGTDTVFTPSYSYQLLNVNDVDDVLTSSSASGAGNAAGAASTTPTSGTAAITASGTAITTGSAFTLTASSASGFTSHQWRLNNADIAGATSAAYNVASAQSANAGVYTVVLSNPAGDSIVSTPVTISVNAAPPAPPATPPASGGGGGGGSPSIWFFLVIGALAGIRRLTKRV